MKKKENIKDIIFDGENTMIEDDKGCRLLTLEEIKELEVPTTLISKKYKVIKELEKKRNIGTRLDNLRIPLEPGQGFEELLKRTKRLNKLKYKHISDSEYRDVKFVCKSCGNSFKEWILLELLEDPILCPKCGSLCDSAI